LCRGCQRSEGRMVSVKLLSEVAKISPEDLERCQEESAAIGVVNSPNIIPVVGSGYWKGRFFFALEEIEGEPLAAYLLNGYRFSSIEILQIAEGVGRALQAASDAGVVHGAIQPSCIFLSSAGRVMLAGYGTKRSIRSASRSTPSLASLRYLSPEQMRKEPLSYASDLYSLGVVLYELATGKTPFDGFESTTSLLYQVSYVDPPSTRVAGSLIPLDLDRLILRCLQKDPENRSTTPDSFLADVASVREALEMGEAPEHGDDVGDFDIYEDQVIGEGGMGTLYRGKQRSLGRPVAIKVIRGILTANPDCVQRFRREAELLAQVNDSSVVQVFGTGSWKGRMFYAMELVRGEDLASALAAGKTLTTGEILDIAEGVARALKAAWSYRIIHRDIKPSNILITPDRKVKVADFGLAKSLRFPRTDSQLIAGTSDYISPEQAVGLGVDIRTDLYSLGVVMFELVAGKPPFKSDESFMGVVYQHVHHPPPQLREISPQVPEPLADLIHRCLNKDPKSRFEDPAHFLRELDRVREQVSADRSSSPLRRLVRMLGQRRRPILAEGAVLALILAASVGVWTGMSRGAQDSERTDALRRAYDLARDMGDFATATSLAEAGAGRQSKEYREAEHSLREFRAASCLQREDWESAATLFGSLEAESGGSERLKFGRARRYCESLADGRRCEAQGRLETALAIYRQLLTQDPVYEAYLRKRIESLSQAAR
ncbi:MAG TPA: protein kinase, partial [Planctomycetota bacterium]|nr:protein kinase [Planctomycetota bacterium]